MSSVIGGSVQNSTEEGRPCLPCREDMEPCKSLNIRGSVIQRNHCVPDMEGEFDGDKTGVRNYGCLS